MLQAVVKSKQLAVRLEKNKQGRISSWLYFPLKRLNK